MNTKMMTEEKMRERGYRLVEYRAREHPKRSAQYRARHAPRKAWEDLRAPSMGPVGFDAAEWIP